MEERKRNSRRKNNKWGESSMSKQKEIMKALKVVTDFDPKAEYEKRVNFLADYLQYSGAETYVLGISGGQDSTLAGYIAQKAVEKVRKETKKQVRFVAIRLPYGVQQDEKDAEDAIAFINPDQQMTVNIKSAVDASIAAIEFVTKETVSQFVKGNEKARERMKVQYLYAGMHKGLVIGTDHAAEAITGFFTKFGDGAADVVPLYGLNKTQGRDILRMLDCPEHLYTKVPTADLEDDKPMVPDEVALGVTYQDIDAYLQGKEVSDETKEKIESWYNRTEHKRHDPVNVYDTWWKK